jgi:hypothetical protein
MHETEEKDALRELPLEKARLGGERGIVGRHSIGIASEPVQAQELAYPRRSGQPHEERCPLGSIVGALRARALVADFEKDRLDGAELGFRGPTGGMERKLGCAGPYPGETGDVRGRIMSQCCWHV